MVKLIRGKYGPKLLCAGVVISMDEASEKRLVDRKVAVYVNPVTNSKSCDNASEEDGGDTQEDSNVDLKENGDSQEENTNQEDVVINAKSEEELGKMRSKKEIIDYAESIGLQGLSEDVKKDELIESVLNYIEENFEVEDEL
ncbi:MAG TPA: hypothetical protein DCE48_01540 [Lachnospiraceae bacterium]|uniref:hypothetical protein n=1 Tax=Anaerosporobacter sp. TaxID=1872529 RepID=UPI000EDDCEEB|nr:hypothetical protein [Anaerosporobacter sp.]HAB59393.1 hypothetical protein [Lachnospiraceae bacterium]